MRFHCNTQHKNVLALTEPHVLDILSNSHKSLYLFRFLCSPVSDLKGNLKATVTEDEQSLFCCGYSVL